MIAILLNNAVLLEFMPTYYVYVAMNVAIPV